MMQRRPVRVWVDTADGYWFDLRQERPGVWVHRHLPPDLDSPRVWAQFRVGRFFRRYRTVPISVVPSLASTNLEAGDTITLSDIKLTTEYPSGAGS